MSPANTIYGFLSALLLFAGVISGWLCLFFPTTRPRLFVLSGAIILAFLPRGGVSTLEILHGVIGELSIPSLALSLLVILRCISPHPPTCLYARRSIFQKYLVHDKSLLWFCAGILALAVIFYPMTLGLSMIDPYAWGYSPGAMLLALFFVVIALELFRLRNAAIIILLSVAAYALRLMPSNNLWDYLMDPVLAISSLFVCAEFVVFRIFSTNPSAGPSPEPTP